MELGPDWKLLPYALPAKLASSLASHNGRRLLTA
jgi:hypothetical protein